MVKQDRFPMQLHLKLAHKIIKSKNGNKGSH
jgi:hypothetical protein